MTRKHQKRHFIEVTELGSILGVALAAALIEIGLNFGWW